MWQRVWIWKRKLKKGVTYCLGRHDEQGRIRTESVGTDRRLAERLRSEREVELNNGQLATTRPSSYDDFVREELKIMAGRVSESYIGALRFVLGSFGDACKPRMLEGVSPAMIESYFALRVKQVAVATANRDLRTLKAALNRAVSRGYLKANPGARIKQVREPERPVRVLTPDEVARVLDACPSDLWRAFIAVALTTGMRRGEILALRWQDVDADEALIHVRNTPGHASISTTVKYYTGVMPEALKAAQAKLPFGDVIRDISYPYHGDDGAIDEEAALVGSPSSAAS